MKIIKSFLLLVVCVCTTVILYAQDTKSEIAKPIEANIAARQTTPEPKPVFTPASSNNGQASKQPAAADDKAEQAKPQIAPAKDLIAPAATLTAERREDAVRPVPIMPAQKVNKAPAAAPAKPQANKLAVVPEKQR